MRWSKYDGISSRSYFLPVSSSRWWAGIFSNIALILALFLQSLPSSGQSGPPTPHPGLSDYENFKKDMQTISLELMLLRQAFESALSENASLRESLKKAEDAVLKHSRDSTTSSEQDLRELETLRRRSNESDALVNSLREDLEFKQTEYDKALKKAQDTAKTLEAENRALKWGCAILAALAGAGAVYGGGHLLGAW